MDYVDMQMNMIKFAYAYVTKRKKEIIGTMIEWEKEVVE